MEFPLESLKKIIEIIKSGTLKEAFGEFLVAALAVIRYGVSVLTGQSIAPVSNPTSSGPAPHDAETLATHLEAACGPQDAVADASNPQFSFPALDWKAIIKVLLNLINTAVQAL